MDSWYGFEWEWLRPQYLWLLAVALPILVLFHFRSLSDFPLWQRWLSLLVRSLVVTCLVLALTGLMLLTRTQRQMVVYAIDHSQSIDRAAREAADAYVRSAAEAAADDSLTLRYLAFDSQANAAVSDAAAVVEPAAVASDAASPQGTDLAAAIDAAVAAIPPSYVPRVVLLSDGNATVGNAVAAAAAAGVPIDTVPLPVRSEPEIQLAAVETPAQVRQGEPFFVEVVVNTNVAASGFVDLYRNDVRIDDGGQNKVELQQGENRFRFRQSILDERQVTFAARLRQFGDRDTLLDNNEAAALVYSAGRPRALLIDPDVEQADALRWALDEQQIDIEVRPPEGLPRDLAELQGYECLLLSNVPATAMTLQQMDLLRTYVQDLGGGLIMLGGDQSFGLGGYYKTQLEEILPVRSNFEKEREQPGFAMILVIDRSGSMGGEKIELAKDAARAAVELMGPRDSIGVIAFDNETYWVSQLRPGTDRGYLIDQIATIDAGGGTNMYPAMEQAYQALAGSEAKRKHCILLSDGISSPGAFAQLAGEMSSQQMTVSTVAMGDGADAQLLQDIARLGDGRHYMCTDPQSVPQVFAKETVEASKEALQEEPFLPMLARPTQVLAGIDIELSPLLLGYVVTAPKPTSELILTTENGDPLLAWWRYGLGMTVAFTSDAKSRWAAEWLAWPEFGVFWAQVIRHAMRKNDSQGMFVQLQTVGGRTRVTLDAAEPQGAFLDSADAQLTVIDPHLDSQQHPLRQTAPGRYETWFASGDRGVYQLDLAAQAPGHSPLRQSRGFVVSYPEELRLQPVGTETLQDIARVSGGMYQPTPQQSLRSDERQTNRPVTLWPWLLMAAIVLFVGDVGLRRVALGG
ncbi:VWA domain-containing protein [Roseimaritima ulvae]|uniref:von Willebrand factor type A domain protein n=1 Tax=Roseimaritima ulvae TaxID=980254 RepID=A0A5B9QR57_9BACT|nr:VWA domain-containing protein [Roseimaritima ulvae]QEG41587.1 von Willebrand factor type A domain protein [Roseimaritima ulvae]